MDKIGKERKGKENDCLRGPWGGVGLFLFYVCMCSPPLLNGPCPPLKCYFVTKNREKGERKSTRKTGKGREGRILAQNLPKKA